MGHWIDFNWKLKSIALGCLHVDKRHIAQNLSDFYEKFAAIWNITDKIVCVVTDCTKHGCFYRGNGLQPYPLYPHCFELSILASLKEEQSLPIIKKCRNLVEHFKHSSANTSDLKSSHSSACLLKDDVLFHKFQQYVAIRWNSTYMVLARLLEVKDAIMKYLVDYQKNYCELKLTESDWDKIKKFPSVLGTLSNAMEYIGSEQYTTCSAVLPLEAFLQILLIVNDDDPGYIARFKIATITDFTNKIEDIDALLTLQMAVALDPRYKKLTCLRSENRETV